MTRTVNRKRRARNLKPLPLFEWATNVPAARQVPSLAVRRLQRAGYSPATARLYAELAGLPTEDE